MDGLPPYSPCLWSTSLPSSQKNFQEASKPPTARPPDDEGQNTSHRHRKVVVHVGGFLVSTKPSKRPRKLWPHFQRLRPRSSLFELRHWRLPFLPSKPKTVVFFGTWSNWQNKHPKKIVNRSSNKHPKKDGVSKYKKRFKTLNWPIFIWPSRKEIPYFKPSRSQPPESTLACVPSLWGS